MFIKQSTAVRNLVFRMLSTTDGFTPTTGLTVTVTLSKNGGAFAAAAGAVTEIANGYYELAANATDSNTLGGLILYATGTGAKGNATFEVVAFDPRSATNLGLSGLPTANPGAANGVLIAGANAAVNFADGVVISKTVGTGLSISGESGVVVNGSNGAGFTILGTAAGLSIFGGSGADGIGLAIGGKSGAAIIADDGIGLAISGSGDAMLGVGAGLQITSAHFEAIRLEGATNGIYMQGGSSHGLHIFGGNNSSGLRIETQGNGDGVTLVKSGSGVDLRANLTGNITGNLSGSVGSVTGNLGGNVVGNVNGFVHALDAGAIVANTITDGALTAAKFGTGFIVSGSFAASADTHLAAAIGPGVWTVSSASPTANTYGDLLANFGQGIETGITFKQSIRAMLAVAAGIVTGGGTTSPVFKNPAGNATRVTATVDGSGNRSSVTITA